MVTAGSAAAQLGGAGGPAFSTAGLLWSAGALGGVVGTSLLAVPVLPRLGALAVTVYACGLAGLMLLAAAIAARTLGGQPILRTPTPAQLAALAYLTIAITAIVFIAWYGALERLGVDRTGLFNGLVPVTSLAAVALTGTGAITPPSLLGALAVLAGVILGLRRASKSTNQRGRGEQARGAGALNGSGQMRCSVAASGIPSKYWSRTWRNTGSPGAACRNSVTEERSFIASTSPKICSAVRPGTPVRMAAHSTRRPPRTGWAR